MSAVFEEYVKGTHPACFRSGEWAKIVATVPTGNGPGWLVQFADGATDIWPIHGSGYGYRWDVSPFDLRAVGPDG